MAVYGNVNVKYAPCKSAAQLHSAADYILGKKEQLSGYDLSLYLLCFISILFRSHTVFLFKSSLKVSLTGIAKIIAYFGQTFFRKSKETFCLFQFAAADISAGAKS